MKSTLSSVSESQKPKADQKAVGHVIPISTELSNLIELWREKIGAKSGFTLRTIDKRGTVASTLLPGSI